MFENVGKKLMGLAKFICWLGIISSVIFGIVILAGSSERYSPFRGLGWVGFLTMILGSLFSWISSWTLYAFGEITDNVEELKNRKPEPSSDSKPFFTSSANAGTVSPASQSKPRNNDLPDL